MPEAGAFDLPHGGRLWYEIAGRGPSVTFVHPGLWDSRTWDREFAAWSDRFRVVRYDLRGYGRSSRLDGGAYSHVRDLVSLLDHLEVGRTALVGCSMGGAIALDTSLEHPDRVSALVLVAAGLGGFEEDAAELAWWDERDGPIVAALEAGDLEEAERLRLRIWAPLGTDDEAGRRIRDIAFDNLHELTMDESGEEELDPPAAERLDDVTAPTLVLIAEHDPPDMRRIGQTLLAGIPGATGGTIDGADHVVNVRQPERFDAAVLPFLAANATG
jgi:pimeloyl-ACP methyl ester carboxylesterase